MLVSVESFLKISRRNNCRKTLRLAVDEYEMIEFNNEPRKQR